MTEAITTIETVTELMVVPTEPLVHLVARNALEMKDSQHHLKDWLQRKLTQIDAEITEIQTAIDYAKSHKWSVKAHQSQKSRALTGRVFYEKILDAVEAGYTVVPEFPIDVFAIRVDRTNPVQGDAYSTYGKPALSEEQPDVLSSGEGEYVSELPKARHWDSQHDDGKDGKVTHHNVSAIAFADIAFPIAIARPEIMDATAQAMALKVFDRIGICPKSATRKRDPMIIGQILLKQSWYGSYREVNFLIGWHLNLEKF
jgi:hypothetical protein